MIRSFRSQIAMISVVISGLVIVIFSGIVWALLYREKLNTIDRFLFGMGERQMEHAIRSRSFLEFNRSFSFVFGEQQNRELIVWLRRGANETIYRSSHWPEPLDLSQFSEWDPGSVPSEEGEDDVDPESEIPGGFEDRAEDRIEEFPGPPRRPRRGSPGRRPGGFRRGVGEGFQFRGPPGFDASQILTIDSAGDSWRVAHLRGSRLDMLVGRNLNEFHYEINRMRNAFLIALPVALFLIGGGGLQISRRALKPIETLTATAEKVTAKGLNQRIPVSRDVSEFDRLIDVFNGMLDRLETSFHQANRFTADASHELKTPLTIIQGELESAMDKTEPNSKLQETFKGLLEEVHRLKSIIKSLLLLSEPTQANSG